MVKKLADIYHQEFLSEMILYENVYKFKLNSAETSLWYVVTVYRTLGICPP